MNKISRLIFGFGFCALCVAMTGCIDETEPTVVATQQQIKKSSSATEALLMAMPAYMNDVDQKMADDGYHFWFGYSAIMHARDLMTGDCGMLYPYSGHFRPWLEDYSIGKDDLRPRFIWNYYYHFIMTADNLISAIDTTSATKVQLGYVGAGYAYRALLYLDMAQMYEFLPNDKTSATGDGGNDVTNYTVPIVTESTSLAEASNNPRVKKDAMVKFILSDLDKAEKYISNLSLPAKSLPHLDCVYGLKARLYLWNSDYANAQKYARLAINASDVTPMTKDEALNTATGFNDPSVWMWGIQQTSEDPSVDTGILNWTSWVSNETTFGYAGAGPTFEIDASMYKRIDDTDWRKLEWKAPADSKLSGKESYIDAEAGAKLPVYASLKFRPNKGDRDNYQVGAASAYPIMRVEEMYFIEAEAAAHLDPEKGKDLLVDFMKKYRDPEYVCNANSESGIIDEIIFQKRVELWGEGLPFYDYKRLNMSVTRGYTGTNIIDAARLNTNGRPAWMNFVIPRSEESYNKAISKWNNPDPSSVYTPWVAK